MGVMLISMAVSTMTRTIYQEVEAQTNDLLGGRLASLQFVSVQQQTNRSDSGIIAIAIAMGTNPSHVFTFSCMFQGRKNEHVSISLTLINSV